MKRRQLGWLGLGVLLGLVLGAGPARGQGFVVDRQIVGVHAPMNRAHEIREVSIDARVRDQVAEVRVAQTFHNPGSTQIEAEYLFPLPDEAGVSGPRADGRRQGTARPGLAEGRGPADLRGDRPDQARPGLARIHGPGALPRQRLPDPAGGRPQGHAPLYPGLPARPRRRRVHLSARHPEAFVDRPDPKAGLRPPDRRAGTRSSRSIARATTWPSTRGGEREARVTLDRR